MSTLANALLSVDSYREEHERDPREIINADGHQYELKRTFSDASGYQGVLYQDLVTGNLILAHRGTEFGRQPVRDGVIADLGMVVTGFNAQVAAARRATEAALAYAQDKARDCGPLELTVTGHSLGGFLAQYTGHRYGLHTETFDAYGAAGLVADLRPDVGHIVNHVRATDFVSAASQHVGEVRIYAAQQDVEALQRAGYANDGRRLSDLRNPLAVMAGVGIAAHYSRNFLPDNDLGIGGSIIGADNQQRYLHHQPMFDKYRQDVATLHDVLALPRNVVDGVIDHVRHAVSGRPLERDFAELRVTGCPRPLEGERLPGAASVVPAPGERLHGEFNSPLYQDIHAGVVRLEQALGRTPDQASERVIASLYAKARQAGIERADHVVMAGSADDPRFVLVRGDRQDPAHQRVHVRAADALATPVETSLAQAASQPGHAVPGYSAVLAEEPVSVPMALAR